MNNNTVEDVNNREIPPQKALEGPVSDVREEEVPSDTPEDRPGEGHTEPCGAIEPKRGRGRPKKTEIQAKKRGNRGVRGRPKGDAAIINDYKARMLSSPKSRRVLEKIFDAALNDEHKHQGAAWKLIMDRIAPNTYFEKDKLSGGRPSIAISITGIGQGGTVETRVPNDDITDVDYEVQPYEPE